MPKPNMLRLADANITITCITEILQDQQYSPSILTHTFPSEIKSEEPISNPPYEDGDYTSDTPSNLPSSLTYKLPKEEHI